MKTQSEKAKRRADAIKMIKTEAKRQGKSFTKFVKEQVPGWPSWNGPKLTTRRAEVIAEIIERNHQPQAGGNKP